MSFLALISKFTGRDGRDDGRVGGRVDGVIWRGGGSIVVGRGNISGIFIVFNFAMFFQHTHLETIISFTFKFTDLTLKLKLCWGGGIFIGCGNISGFCYVIIGHDEISGFFYVGVNH